MNRISLFIVIIFFLFCENSAQFRYSFGIGSGLYFTDQSAIYDNSQKYFSGQLKLNYSLKENEKRVSIQLFAFPEFFGKDDLVTSLKLKINAEYSESYETIGWGLSLSKKNYFYNGTGIDNNFDIYILQSFLEWKLGEIPIRSVLGFAYQDISGTYEQNSDLIFIDNNLFHYFNPYTHLSYGLYIEKFSLSSEAKNTGWRIGPTFGINYLKNFVFNAQLKYLIHLSNTTQNYSNETTLQLVAGKLFLNNLSAFIMADYNWRNLKYVTTTNLLPYSLIDNDNNVHLKLGYNFSNYSELYLKAGYFNQDFLERNLSLKGWNIIAGVKFGN